MKNTAFMLLMLAGLMMPFNAKSQTEFSYVWGHQYPALAEPQIICCFDFVGTVDEDDFNGNLLASLEGLLGVNIQESIDNKIINNHLSRVWRWDELPIGDGPVQMSILNSEVSNPSMILADRMAGLAEVDIQATVPLSVFTGNVTSGVMTLTSNTAIGVFYNEVYGSIDLTQTDLVIEIPLNQATIVGTFNVDPLDCQGVCADTTIGTDPVTLGNVEVSGLIHVADEIDVLNNLTSNCACAGIDSQIPLFSFVEENGNLITSCQYNSGDLTPQSCGLEFSHCQSIQDQCNTAGLLSAYYDVDTNSNNIDDSKSVGLLLGISGVTVTGFLDLIFKDDFETSD